MDPARAGRGALRADRRRRPAAPQRRGDAEALPRQGRAGYDRHRGQHAQRGTDPGAGRRTARVAAVAGVPGPRGGQRHRRLQRDRDRAVAWPPAAAHSRGGRRLQCTSAERPGGAPGRGCGSRRNPDACRGCRPLPGRAPGRLHFPARSAVRVAGGREPRRLTAGRRERQSDCDRDPPRDRRSSVHRVDSPVRRRQRPHSAADRVHAAGPGRGSVDVGATSEPPLQPDARRVLPAARPGEPRRGRPRGSRRFHPVCPAGVRRRSGGAVSLHQRHPVVHRVGAFRVPPVSGRAAFAGPESAARARARSDRRGRGRPASAAPPAQPRSRRALRRQDGQDRDTGPELASGAGPDREAAARVPGTGRTHAELPAGACRRRR